MGGDRRGRAGGREGAVSDHWQFVTSEHVDSGAGMIIKHRTDRLKTSGGWLCRVTTQYRSGGEHVFVTLTFVPDTTT